MNRQDSTVRNVVIICVFIFVCIVLYFIYSTVDANRIRSARVQIEDPNSLPVEVYDNNGKKSVESTAEFSVDFTKNENYVFFVNKDGVDTEPINLGVPQNEENVFVVTFETTIGETNDTDVEQAIEEQLSDSPLDLKDYKSYQDNKWILSGSTTPGEASDGELAVYTLLAGEYRKVLSGTGIDEASLIDAGVPRDVAKNMMRDINDVL